MTSEQLLVIAGAVLAILFAYVPGLANWYQPLGAEIKRLIMLGVLAVITGAGYGLSCASILHSVTCDQKGAIALVLAFVGAVVSNQGTFALLPKVGLNKSIEPELPPVQ